MSFLDDVRNAVMTDDKEKAILKKIADHKEHLISLCASSIVGDIMNKIKDDASSGNFSNNIIKGEIESNICKTESLSEDEIKNLPLDKLQAYVNNNNRTAFTVLKGDCSNSYTPQIILTLLEKNVINEYGTSTKTVGLFFKHQKSIRKKMYFCKVFADETQAMIEKVKQYAKNEGIEIIDAFFKVTFTAYIPDSEAEHFTRQISINDLSINEVEINYWRSDAKIQITDYPDLNDYLYYRAAQGLKERPKIVFKYVLKL